MQASSGPPLPFPMQKHCAVAVWKEEEGEGGSVEEKETTQIVVLNGEGEKEGSICWISNDGGAQWSKCAGQPEGGDVTEVR